MFTKTFSRGFIPLGIIVRAREASDAGGFTSLGLTSLVLCFPMFFSPFDMIAFIMYNGEKRSA